MAKFTCDRAELAGALVGVKTSALRRAVERVRTLTGSGILHVEVSDQRLRVVGAHGRGRAVLPVEVVTNGMAGVERFSFEGPALGTALGGLRGELTSVGLWLPQEGSEQEGLVRVSLDDTNSIAVLPSTGDRFPDYRALLQSSPGCVLVDPALLHGAVAHAGAIARADGEVSPVLELRPRQGGRMAVVPVVEGVTCELDARWVVACVESPMADRLRYPADALATALLTFDGGPVTIHTGGRHADATIVAYDGQFSDQDLARWLVPGIAAPMPVGRVGIEGGSDVEM